jgi:hypothetical protein
MRGRLHDDDDEDDDEISGDVFAGRVYVHTRCGGQTRVSGGDYAHICDPFWPCTSTYCCTCSGFAPLHEVRWADTDEPVSEYRRRLRAETPGLIKAWRYGVGFLFGGAIGALVGLLVWLSAQAPRDKIGPFAGIGGLVGAFVCYILGTMILNRALGIDYRRMR